MAVLKQRRSVRIIAKGTFNVSPVSAWVDQFVISCPVAGTAWTLAVKDRASSPNTWITPITMAINSGGIPTKIFWDEPLFFEGGIDIISAGTTAGEASVAINFAKSDSQQ